MGKIDPYNHKEKYLNWKTRINSEIIDLTEENRVLFKRYLSDMECGLNVSSSHKKGSRSFLRLNTVRIRIHTLMRQFELILGLNKITDVTEEQIHKFFLSMRNGEIRRKNGEEYRAVSDYVQDFKAFWHWWQRSNRKNNVEIRDITTDLDTSDEKPKWVYLTEDQVRIMADNAKYEYKVLIWFLFDTGIRAPTELMNVKVSDFYNDFKELNIRNETSKTFGRRIKLMLCSSILREYVQKKNISKEDYIFKICPTVTNRYLKRLAKRLFGEEESPAGEIYSNITMYDFRHVSCCYWLPRYKSESALKYRFGWKKSDKIHYYSELLGMRDTISEEDLLIDLTKAQIEKDLEQSKKENALLSEKVRNMEIQMSKIMELTENLEVLRDT